MCVRLRGTRLVMSSVMVSSIVMMVLVIMGLDMVHVTSTRLIFMRKALCRSVLLVLPTGLTRRGVLVWVVKSRNGRVVVTVVIVDSY